MVLLEDYRVSKNIKVPVLSLDKQTELNTLLNQIAECKYKIRQIKMIEKLQANGFDEYTAQQISNRSHVIIKILKAK